MTDYPRNRLGTIARHSRHMGEPQLSGMLQPIVESGSGSTPLYRQVKSALLRLLESGQLGPGQALPNESQIAAALHVSIGTLRKAVDELVHEHILVRRQGKGTFVAMHSQDRFMFQFFHVEPRPDPLDSRVVQEREYPVVDNLGFGLGKATELEAWTLRIRPGDAVWRIDNALNLNGKTVVHDRIVLSHAMFKGLTEKRFKERPNTIYNLYQTEYGISVIRAQERVRATSVTSEIGRVLGLRAGMPVLEVHRVASTFGERPVELRVSTVSTQHHDYVSLISKR